jgi:carboxyl-terminal processing protease
LISIAACGAKPKNTPLQAAAKQENAALAPPSAANVPAAANPSTPAISATPAANNPATPATTNTNAPAVTPATQASANGPVLPPSKPAVRPPPITQHPDRTGKIYQLVGRILENAHYLQHPYDKEISQRQLKNYLESLDYNHLIFLQSDADEFGAKYGNELDQAAVRRDISPAFEIFNRFVQRLEERKKLVDQLLKEKYDFTTDERFNPSREKAAFPKDLAEAEQLWRSRIKFELLQGRLTKEKPEETVKKIAHRYENLLKQVYEYDEDEVTQTFLNALTHSYDPHTDYFTPDEAENFDINAIKLTLSGIGAVLRSEDGYAKIEKLVPGGPADLDRRLKPNDRIVAVAQGEAEPVDVVDMKLTKVVDLIRGKRGTKVRLIVIPATAADSAMHEEIVLKRDDIKLTEQYAKGEIFQHRMSNGQVKKLGVIILPQFYEKTVEDCGKIIERLKQENVSGIILDLRKNGGGLLDQAVDLAGLFIKKGPVVQVKNARGEIQVLSTDVHPLYDGPLIVLTSHLSASASEIVAGALQDYGRALIVGDQSTHGKGTVQTLLPLERLIGFGFSGDPGKLKITVQKFYRIAGGSTQKKGVISDVTLPSLLDYYEIGERTLPNCLPYDEVDKVDYQPFNLVSSYLPDLVARSAQRVGKSRDFAYVKEDIDLLKQKLADKSVSLNEAKRMKEKNDLVAQSDARKAERAKRTDPADKIYDVTVDMIDHRLPLTEWKPVKTAATKTDASSSSTPDEDQSLYEQADATNDPELSETLNILSDYADLLTGKGVMTTLSNAPVDPVTQ